MRKDEAKKTCLIEPVAINGLKIGSQHRKLRDLSQTSQGLTIPSGFIEKLRKLGWVLGADLEISLVTTNSLLDGFIMIRAVRETDQ